MRPDEFAALPMNVKAFIMAAIDIRAESEKKAEAEAKAAGRKGRRRH